MEVSAYWWLDPNEALLLPVLDLLVERHSSTARHSQPSLGPPAYPQPSGVDSSVADSTAARVAMAANGEWFPNRQLRRTDMNPQTLWRLITSYIVPELMDR